MVPGQRQVDPMDRMEAMEAIKWKQFIATSQMHMISTVYNVQSGVEDASNSMLNLYDICYC